MKMNVQSTIMLTLTLAAADEVGTWDSLCLLQTGLKFQNLIRQRNQSQPHSTQRKNAWFDWSTSISDSKAEISHGEMVRIWDHLGHKLWFEVIDGRFHQKGPGTIDGSSKNARSGQDGQFSEHSLEQYAHFSNESAWASLWTADLFAQLNAGFRGESCDGAGCSNLYLYQSWNSFLVKTDPRKELDSIFEEYYRHVLPLKNVERKLRLQQVLPHLAKLNLQLAQAHPFEDANARLRVLLTNFELVRNGGHPIVLWDFRYSQNLCGAWWRWGCETLERSCSGNCSLEHTDNVADALARMQHSILDGWCAWEVVAATGASPYQAGEKLPTFDSATRSCL
jgi:hypothetical protein